MSPNPEKAAYSPFILVAPPAAAAPRPASLPPPRRPGQQPRHDSHVRLPSLPATPIRPASTGPKAVSLPAASRKRQFSRHTVDFHQGDTRPVAAAAVETPAVPSEVPASGYRQAHAAGAAAAPGAPAVFGEANFKAGRRRLTFSCRQCSYDVKLPMKLAGRKLRCPKCHSAIRAASACGRSRGANLEHDIESLLHPQRFLFPEQLMVSRFQQLKPALCTAAALATLGTSGWATAKLALGNPEAEAAAQAVQKTDATDPAALRQAAESTVQAYLKADDWQTKATLVRDSARVAPLMESYFRHFGGAGSVAVTSVRAAAPGYYADMDLPQQVSRVRANLADGSTRVFFVEHLPEGPRIEWESSTGWTGTTWEEALETVAEDATLRVLASRDDYFTGGHEEGSHLCLRLADPRTGDRLGYAYMDLDSPDAAALRAAVAGTTASAPVPLMLAVRGSEDSAAANTLTISRFLKQGFRSSSPSSILAGR